MWTDLEKVHYWKGKWENCSLEWHNLLSSLNVIKMIKSRRMGWVCHVATLGYEKCIENFIEKPDGKRPRLKHLGLYCHESQGCYYLNWSPPTQNRSKGQVFFFFCNPWIPAPHLFSIMTRLHVFIYLFIHSFIWLVGWLIGWLVT
jgi:hypothetical protein